MSKIQHILVWRLSAMGDVAMTVPVLKRVIEVYPEIKITVVSKPFFAPIFKDISNIHFIAAEVNGKHKGVAGLYKLFKQIKALEITHVADLHNVLRSKIMRSFFKTIGIPVVTIDKGRAEKKELTKESEKSIQQLKSTHQRYADVFNQLGLPIDLKPISITKRTLSKKASSVLQSERTTRIGIAPFAAFEGKMYPLSLMKKVLYGLSQPHFQLLLFGGGKEEVEKLDTLSSEIPNAFCVAGKFSFEEELALISNLDLMVSMDSGNGHLAAIFGVEVISIWGVTHPYAGFAPFMQSEENQLLPDLEKYPLLPCSVYGNKVFEGYEKVMESIEPNTIIDSIKNALQKKSS